VKFWVEDFDVAVMRNVRSSDNTSHLPAAGSVLAMRYDHRW